MKTPLVRPLTAACAALSISIGAAVALGSPSERAEASVAAANLTEVPGTPFVVPFGGVDLDFATNSIFSSPAVADVTGDGRPDIIVGGLSSVVRVFDIASSRTIQIDPGGADPATGHGATHASPALADIDGDGVDDVVIANTGGRLAAFSVRNGVARQLFNRYVAPEFNGAIVGLFGTPAVDQLGIDDTPDIVTSSWGQTIDVFDGATGTPDPAQRHWLRDTVWSSPVVGDISGDGTKSIVVGGDCDGSGVPQPCYGIGKGGYVWAFRLDGSVRWKHFVRDAVVWSTPALVDLNGDGALDVVVGTGLYFLGPAANQVMALDGRTGQLLWSAPTAGPVLGSPAVGSVGGQPRIWIVSGGGQLMSLDKSGGRVWQQCITDGACSPEAGTFGGVSIADIDNDGSLEAVVQAEQRMKVYDAVSGARETDVRSKYGKTLFASYATPTIASVNGETWIVQLNAGDGNGNLRTDGGDDLVVSVWTTRTPLGAAPWPTFKGNIARTGGPQSAHPRAVGPSERMCFAVTGAPGDTAIVNLTPVLAQGPGYGILLNSKIATRPDGSNVNYTTGSTDPNVAIATIGTDGQVCYANADLNWVHLVADHLGTIKASAYTPATTNGSPRRIIDTRTTGAMIPPSGRLCFAVTGAPGDAAIVNLTPVLAQGPGYGILLNSKIATRPDGSNVNYNAGSTDPNVAIATIGTDGQVCYANADLNWVHLVADHLGTIKASAYTPATTNGSPRRIIDTRTTGAMIPPSGRLCFAVTGAPGDAAIVNLTPVLAQGPGYGILLNSKIATRPDGSNVNYNAGSTDPNVAIATIGTDGQVCYANADLTSIHLVADHLGTIKASAYTPATTNGSPRRIIDTRS